MRFQDGDDYNYEYADFSDQSASGRGTGQQSAYVPVAAFPDPPAIGDYPPPSFSRKIKPYEKFLLRLFYSKIMPGFYKIFFLKKYTKRKL